MGMGEKGWGRKREEEDWQKGGKDIKIQTKSEKGMGERGWGRKRER